MRITVFVAVLLAAMGAIAAWSFANGAGVGVVALRVFLTAVVLQVGYGLVLVISAYVPESRSDSTETLREDRDGKPAPRPIPGANDSSG